MSQANQYADKIAIGLSSLCALHCLGLPLLWVVLPSASALNLNTEAFHVWIVFAVIPTSIYALTRGCKKHQYFHLLAIGFVGLAFLLLAIAIPHALLGEWGEKGLTLIGAGIIAYGHFKNFRLCQKHNDCACPNH